MEWVLSVALALVIATLVIAAAWKFLLIPQQQRLWAHWQEEQRKLEQARQEAETKLREADQKLRDADLKLRDADAKLREADLRLAGATAKRA
jgi:Tfp pilus assembly protein PilO